jgi:hypothetical protein
MPSARSSGGAASQGPSAAALALMELCNRREGLDIPVALDAEGASRFRVASSYAFYTLAL